MSSPQTDRGRTEPSRTEPSRTEPGRTDRVWTARHVYLPHARHTAYLVDVVAPALRESGLTDRFFFLRYWQGGPHLRLRVLQGGDDVRAATGEFFAGLERATPAFTPDEQAEYARGLDAQHELARLEGAAVAPPVPLGTHRDEPYEPEWRKYGGAPGVRIAEDVFRATSLVALDLLGEARRRGAAATTPPLGEALRIMALALAGAGLDDDATVRFLEHYREWWRPYATPDNERAWPVVHERLAEQVAALWDGARGPGAATDPTRRAIADATSRAREEAAAPPGTPVADLTLDGTPYVGALANYVHTTNNRLGLAPAGEGLVADLLLRTVRRTTDETRRSTDETRSSTDEMSAR